MNGNEVGAGLQPGTNAAPGVDAGLRPGTNTIADILRLSTEHLELKGSETPRLDAERLLAKATGLERIELYMQLDRPLTTTEVDTARALVARRAKREPLQYVLGEWGFRGLTLTVDRRALIPRPETEVLVERALALLDGLECPRVLDVGTGSGAIALAIADEHPGAAVTAVDISPDALELAAENAAPHRHRDRPRSPRPFLGLPRGPWDVIVTNPPYVDPADLPSLQPEVRDWEPHDALIADGAVEAVLRGAADVLASGGGVALEVGAGQAGATAIRLRDLGFGAVTITRDLAGIERVVEGVLS